MLPEFAMDECELLFVGLVALERHYIRGRVHLHSFVVLDDQPES